MKGVQCYELFGGIALKNHAFSISFMILCIQSFQTLPIFFYPEVNFLPLPVGLLSHSTCLLFLMFLLVYTLLLESISTLMNSLHSLTALEATVFAVNAFLN